MERTTYSLPLTVLLLLCMMGCPSARVVRNNITDEAALLALKAHITLDPYQILENNWSTSISVCDWVGVTCSLRHHRVTALDTSSMNLTGTLPPQLGNLSFLASLDLSGNNFHGNLPKELENLHRLKVIVLTYNSFNGQIPAWVSSLSKLRRLSLGNNSFIGFIPPSISNLSKLEYLELSVNFLEGEIPPEIFSMATLEHIRMGINSLSGDLPSDICHNLPRLKELSLSWNALSGQIPLTLSNCSELRLLSLSHNKFTGDITGELKKLEKLEKLFLGQNNFIKGEIPKEVSNLYKLEEINLQNNSLSGMIPIGLFNMSNLRVLALSRNQLSGTLPSNMGYGLPNLVDLHLDKNNLGGVIPSSLSNCTKLLVVQLDENEFIGDIPDSLGDLRLLKYLFLDENHLTSPGLKFFTSLTKSRYLRQLSVSENPLDGSLPAPGANDSTLEVFIAQYCKIRGRIPSEIGNLRKLILLALSGNYLTGSVPVTMKALQGLYLDKNFIDGSTLYTLCELQNLFLLNLNYNNISSPLPECLGKITSLRYIYFHETGLTSIPRSFWNLKNLIELTLSSNSLKGSLSPEIGSLKAVTHLDFSMNQLSGDIPNVFVELSSLQYLHLDHNKLEGSIPDSLGKVLSLEELDLSNNNLSGSIPKSLEALKYLKRLNLSFNKLGGSIPSNGPFKDFTSQSFVFNDALCGDSRFQVPPCPISSSDKRSSKHRLQLILIPLGIALTILVMILIFILMRHRRKDEASNRLESFFLTMPKRISYYELLEATNRYDESNLLGLGSFGSVYKGILKDGTFVAVKIFNLQLEGAFKSFDTECEVLRNLRHKNLTRVVSSCSTEDFKALILQYMCNGSLEKWLYSYNYFLNFMQRLSIMIDIACALEYLHYGYSTILIHCDLKPSNVLLDDDMVAHVSDFGIAKLLGEGESVIHTNTLATLGYMAPEYGLEGVVSTRCDVYSFGIMMMEVFTRTKPSDEMFVADFSLKQWVNNSIPNSVIQIVDANLIRPDEEHFTEKLKCLSSIMELALCCSVETPNERINMKDVTVRLKKIKLRFLADCGRT